MDELAVGRRRLAGGRPGHVAIDDEDRIGLAEQRAGVVAEVAGMVGRQRQMPLAVLDHRDREAFGEFGERRHGGAVAAGVGGDDQRVRRPKEQPRRCLYRRFVRRRRRCRHPPRRRIVGEAGERRRQHLARQRQVDRALRRAGGDRERAVDHGFELHAVAQLVIPLDDLA
jgi:hypothetical protein